MIDDTTALGFIRMLADLERNGRHATAATLGGGRELEAARQEARKRGWCIWSANAARETRGNQRGWLLTDAGRAEIAKVDAAAPSA